METDKKNTHALTEFSGHLTLRSLVIGAMGSVLITASSMYIALRMGALPWPTIFAAVLSMTVLKALGRTNVNEINVAHTTMTAGSMVAGGLAFTVPGLYMLYPDAPFNLMAILGVTLGGTFLGVVFTWFIRAHFIEREHLPYPIGIAASETVLVGDERGVNAKILFASLGFSAVFTLLRDLWNLVPTLWMVGPLVAKGVSFGIWMAPMAIGIGYLIGPLYTIEWFLGAVTGYFGLVFLGVEIGAFPDVAAASAFKDCVGIGLMVGTGVGILAKGLLPRVKAIGKSISASDYGGEKTATKWVSIVLLASASILIYAAGVRGVPAFLTILGVWLVTAMSAQITGQTGINPMEIFGITVLLTVNIVYTLGMTEAFYVAAAVAIACGLTGDVMNDFKSGHILKTNPRAQIIAEFTGGTVGAVVSVFVFMAMRSAFGTMGPGTELPAPQAYTVSTMIGGLPNPVAFFIGFVLGSLLYIVGMPTMTLGIGMYLPMFISTTVFVGGIIAFALKKILSGNRERNKSGEKTGILIASGLLGGEGITGVLVALWKALSFFLTNGHA